MASCVLGQPSAELGDAHPPFGEVELLVELLGIVACQGGGSSRRRGVVVVVCVFVGGGSGGGGGGGGGTAATFFFEGRGRGADNVEA